MVAIVILVIILLVYFYFPWYSPLTSGVYVSDGKRFDVIMGDYYSKITPSIESKVTGSAEFNTEKEKLSRYITQLSSDSFKFKTGISPFRDVGPNAITHTGKYTVFYKIIS